MSSAAFAIFSGLSLCAFIACLLLYVHLLHIDNQVSIWINYLRNDRDTIRYHRLLFLSLSPHLVIKMGISCTCLHLSKLDEMDLIFLLSFLFDQIILDLLSRYTFFPICVWFVLSFIQSPDWVTASAIPLVLNFFSHTPDHGVLILPHTFCLIDWVIFILSYWFTSLFHFRVLDLLSFLLHFEIILHHFSKVPWT